jgi:intein/homing endonuclease
MNLSEHNRRIALSRWNRVHGLEIDKMNDNDPENIRNKALLCGFLAGDGSVQERKEKSFIHYQIDFFADDDKMMDTYLDLMKTVYGKLPTIRKHNRFTSARITSKTIVQDLKKIASFGIKTWAPPESIFKINGTKEAWLNGFFSTEGYVEPKAIKIQTVNKNGMTKVAELLKELGIENGQYKYTPKNKNHSEVHIIRITKKDSLNIFKEKIGFSHKKKTEVLNKALGL